MMITARKRFGILSAFAALVLMLGGCSDDGDKPTGPDPPEQGEPAINRLIPTRTVIGDTVMVQGTEFGATQDVSFLEFARAGGGGVEATIVSWHDEEIRALVPDEAATGKVSILRPGEIQSNEVDFSVAPQLVTFAGDLVGLFQSNGCAGCHGGSGGLTVSTAASTIAGGNSGQAVLPRRSAESILYQKTSTNPPFGAQMPQGCDPEQTCLTPEEMLLIADWIDQGARDN